MYIRLALPVLARGSRNFMFIVDLNIICVPRLVSFHLKYFNTHLTVRVSLDAIYSLIDRVIKLSIN
jgi:hypothetical protein